MARIRVSTTLDAPPERVWADIEDVGSHAEWMADAVAIRFLSDQRQGEGTRFECDTRVGPITLTDVMEITEWEPERAMGVDHVGVVGGTGRFTLTPIWGGRTRFQWEEELRFPLWLGGPIGALVGRPVLAWIWRRNLRALQRRF
jgi:uncharacterized protein YndB with AHSA1/START domain